ncbi:hybrid sensor histidine kinase/response regulator [Chryseotalea sanaruensis]|uniref:histidine kinase n=1 Tax=Chryseotalea sanaruensis TaxID=2482724 RepID=A0A401UBE9_9BACT|nr:sensor histidine kinase [Chryseotalea sanaruensis]GCC52211.1 hybrid sensor histidine kinase/response regulator [Chryseotalea sanaruensis]
MRSKFFAFFFFFGTITLIAQRNESSVFFDHYTIPGVIKSTFVASLEQDEFGLIWFGTSSGLFRFNGEEFKHYPYRSDSGLSLEERQITSVHWDFVNNRLIIGTRMMGLLAFSYQNNTIVTLTTKEETIHDIAQTADGRIWVATANGLFELAGNELKGFADIARSLGALPLITKGDSLWVGLVGKVSLYVNGKKNKDIEIKSPKRIFPHTMRASALFLDKDQKLWVGTEKEGVMVFDIDSGELVREFLPDSRPFYSRINAIYQDKTDLIWMLTKAEGLAIFDPVNQTTKLLQQDIYQENTLGGNNCYAILEDKTGLVWVGTNGAVNFFDREQRKFIHYAHQPNNVNSLSDNMVRSVFEDEGLLWVGTDGGFINLIDREKNSIERIAIKGKDFPEHESIVPFAFAKLNSSTILVGTSAGLLTYNKHTKSFAYHQPSLPYLQGKRVRHLLIRDNLLYGIVVGLMFKFDLTTHAFKAYKLPTRNNVSVMHVDKQNRFWVGSNSAVSILNTKTDELTYYRLPKDTANFLILNIEEVNGKIWLSTMNYGIFEVTENEGKISIERNINNTSGLVDNTVYATVPDDFGNVWITTNRGLSRLDPGKRFTTYQVSEGVQAEEFNRMCNLKLSNGSIVVGGINGINIIDPLRAIKQTAPLNPVIYSLTLRKGNEVVELDKFTLMDSVIKLDSDETSFTVRFGVTDYRKPSRFIAEYKLEGFDEGWQKSNAVGKTNYSQLSPGRYTFKVRITNPAGEQRIRSLIIFIKPPFWMTWWFRLILSFIVLSVAVMSFKIRGEREKKDKEKLEELLRIRTREIEQSREQLANLNEKKDLIFSILSHDLRSPLTTLKGFLGLLIDNGENFSREEIKKHAELIRASVANSLDLIDNTLFWSLSQMGGIQCTPGKISVNDLVKKVCDLNQLALTRKSIILRTQIEDNLFVTADENMLYVILRNLVSNAIKFTPDGKKIVLSAYRQSTEVSIVVKDEGVGMNKEYINKLLTEAHPTIKKGTSNEKGTGLGLVLCQQFVALQQGTLKIESEEGIGSIFTITFPAV